MSRKVVRMTLDHLAELEAPCRSCVFWELDPVRRQRVEERFSWASVAARSSGDMNWVPRPAIGTPVGSTVFKRLVRPCASVTNAPWPSDAWYISSRTGL